MYVNGVQCFASSSFNIDAKVCVSMPHVQRSTACVCVEEEEEEDAPHFLRLVSKRLIGRPDKISDVCYAFHRE